MTSSEQDKELKVNITPFTSPTGISLEVQSMDRESTHLFIGAVMAEAQGGGLKQGASLPPLSEIVQKRIDAFELPIKFTPIALVAIHALVANPGQAICLLIDALNKFEGETIDMDKLAELYPFGFYTKDSFQKYVDEYLKPRKVKWAEIY